MTLSVVEEANAPSTGDNSVCSDGESKEDKYSGSQRSEAGQGAEVPPRWDSYAIEVDQRRNCFACR